MRLRVITPKRSNSGISIHAPREGCDPGDTGALGGYGEISIHAPREGCDRQGNRANCTAGGFQSTHPARGATGISNGWSSTRSQNFNPRTPRGVRPGVFVQQVAAGQFQSTHPARGATMPHKFLCYIKRFQSTHPARGATVEFPLDLRPVDYFNPRTPRGVRQQTLPKSREFAWLNLLICTRGRRLSIQKQTRLCSIKLSFMLFGCEPAGEGVSSWTSHATKSKVRLEGRSAYSQSARSSAHSDFPGNKSGDCPVRGP